MSRAEDLAKALYPDWEMTGVSNFDGQEESMVRIQRVAYIKGYRQAEKDLELTWEDIRDICTQSVLVEFDLGRNITDERHYTEVLNRFNKQKGK